MRSISFALGVLGALVAAHAMAQAPAEVTEITPNCDQATGSQLIFQGEVMPTPEMWFYQQYQRDHQDPKLAVRRKAEFRSEQRQRRLAAMRWFGQSNSRPLAGPDPFYGDYSPGWRSNNTTFPFRWSALGNPWNVSRVPSNVFFY